MRAATLLLLASTLHAAAPVVVDRVPDRFVPAAYEQQRIEGLLTERMRVNLEGRLLRVDRAGLLGGFQNRPGQQPWIGEHAGKFLHAAANTYRYTRDERLKQLMDGIAKDLMATQLPDGYLGTYKDKDRWTSWDVWVHKYDLLGLLAYHEVTGDPAALLAARRIGHLLYATFGPGKRDILKSSTHAGMAATSVLEPMVQLYRFTADRDHLVFVRYLVDSWSQAGGPRLIESLTEHGSVRRTANAKAYEMMSCLVGLVELYRLTGEERYLKPALAAWADIRDKRLYLTGTTSSAEHFQDDHVLYGEESANVGEGCATVTWLQLSWQLLRTTGEARYAEELERTVYNQLLAAQDPASGDICYFTPMNGRKRPTPGINCCVSSEPRGLSMIPQLAWGTRQGGPAVVLYTGGEFTTPQATVRATADFPRTGKMTFAVTPRAGTTFPVSLRVPAWTRRFNVSVGNQRYPAQPGQWLVIDRAWMPGERIVVDMEMTSQLLSGGQSYPDHVAFQRGPEVLVLAREANPDLPYLHRASPKALSAQLRATKDRNGYEVDGMVAAPSGEILLQQPRPLRLVPFHSAKEYRTWLPRAEKLSVEPVALTVNGKESASRGGEGVGSFTDERPDTVRVTRRDQRADEDWFAITLEQPVTFKRVVFRHGKATAEGGWFDTSGGKPRVQVQREPKGEWDTIATLDGYPATSNELPGLNDGQAFTVELKEPVQAVALRIVGKPGGRYASCAELAGY